VSSVMHRDNPISSTHEMYLKVLHEARGEHGISRVGDLARRLDVSPGTVSTVLKGLERMHFVRHERYGFVVLTEEGKDVAECVIRRYDTIRALLVEVLGVSPETADIDACMMEHAVSPTTVQRMQELLERQRDRRVLTPPVKRRRRGHLCAGCKSRGACRASGETPRG
jgi:DtxR family transcriptional regulator, Mn-dependent transcriptional regulator